MDQCRSELRSEHVSILHQPSAAAPGLSRAFNTYGFLLEMQTWSLLEKTTSLSPIGLYVKDWTQLWRFLSTQLELSLFIHCSVIGKDN